ncbi:MAG: hypothetical protein KC442_07170 [Thermomicrobiales bacterium]|nr:hypothetical protein [Thermomicrobiales bacterium]
MTPSTSSRSITPVPPLAPDPISRRNRCELVRSRGAWTLSDDCVLTSQLTLPARVSLDGGGHTITLAGDAEGFESAAIRVTGGDITNLIVDGCQLLPLAPAYFAAIAVSAPGRISGVSVRNVEFAGAPHSAVGIEVAAFGYEQATATGVHLANITGAGLMLTGDGRVQANRITATGATAAVQVTGRISATLSHLTTDNATIRVLAQDQSRVQIVGPSSAGAIAPQDEARVQQDTLTFVATWDRAHRSVPAAAAPHNQLG